MTNKEFKAWFEGFTEALSGTPTKAQWARIKERVAEIDGEPVTERIYVDRYWSNYQPWPYQRFGATVVGVANAGANLNSSINAAIPFNSTQAMYAAGKAEALS